MRLSIVLSFVLVVLICAPAGAQKNEYFIEEEVDLIRDAQEIQARVPVLLQLADHRLTFLGIKERTEKQKRESRSFFEKLLEKGAQKVIKQPQPDGPKPAEPLDPDKYLADFTKSELLRGYTEALDEVMSNIDDAYERKFDVRGALERFETYLSETKPLLEKYQGGSAAEQAALIDAKEKTQEALVSAQQALEIVPKTERKTP